MGRTTTKPDERTTVIPEPPSSKEPEARPPRAGDVFRCDRCGMEIEVKADCQGGVPRLECCGQPLSKVREE